ncbi:unnamed protein product [Clonostachys rhizophaga]|uniref:Protein kinase domain-containing protein n=1 Tax=Clonostachys rhizophaga TaxID=160324 RepID=A0A9N9V5C8_9HYPO|nr:unnamed protein product [Clonostachys rhizophaga]
MQWLATSDRPNSNADLQKRGIGWLCVTLSLECKAWSYAREAIYQEGVVHMDARRENMLLNPETRVVMIIDFERSRLLSPPRRQLAALQPNKRRRTQDTSGKVKAVSRPRSVESQLEPGFLHDLAGVKGAFM